MNRSVDFNIPGRSIRFLISNKAKPVNLNPDKSGNYADEIVATWKLSQYLTIEDVAKRLQRRVKTCGDILVWWGFDPAIGRAMAKVDEMELDGISARWIDLM